MSTQTIPLRSPWTVSEVNLFDFYLAKVYTFPMGGNLSQTEMEISFTYHEDGKVKQRRDRILLGDYVRADNSISEVNIRLRNVKTIGIMFFHKAVDLDQSLSVDYEQIILDVN